LTTLEERLVALRLPFIQTKALGKDKQCGMKGNFFHIMNSLQETTQILPRRFDVSSTIQVQLMRHMDHEKPYIFQTIRSSRITEAAKYLLKTPVYMEEGSLLDEGWITDAVKELSSLGSENQRDPVKSEGEADHDNVDGQESMVLENQMAEVTRIAPGQGKKPLSLLNDLNAEVASYPSIYCGNKRVPLVKNQDTAKSETQVTAVIFI
jgi:hypothetical protein